MFCSLVQCSLGLMNGTERDVAAYAAGVIRGLRASATATPWELAMAAWGPDCLRTRPMRRGDSALIRLRDQWQVVLRDGLPRDRAAWVLSWQLSSWLLRMDGLSHDEAVRLRSPLAATLLMPRDVIGRALKAAPAPAVASVLGWPLAATMLRDAELYRRPTLLVMRTGYVRARGDDLARLPTSGPALRAILEGPAVGVLRLAVPEGVIVRAA